MAEDFLQTMLQETGLVDAAKTEAGKQVNKLIDNVTSKLTKTSKTSTASTSAAEARLARVAAEKGVSVDTLRREKAARKAQAVAEGRAVIKGAPPKISGAAAGKLVIPGVIIAGAGLAAAAIFLSKRKKTPASGPEKS